MKAEIATFYPTSKAQWRAWLQDNHCSKTAVWLVHYKKSSGIPTISWSDAVDEALCFGWIDSIRKTLDDDRFIQFFSKRKPKGTWSKVNKDKIKLLIDAGLMTTAGFEAITTAKENGSWIILDAIQELNIPKDLSAAFKLHSGSKKFFTSLSKSVRKAILQWIILAKRPETRQSRINEIAELAGQKLKPKQF
ncbi:hypothetical protein EZ449_18875 [Pedobacter frigidisoli]|uniref:Bacteriocin-protection, YdeI or OmpD-Associated n=1 Tax=Pedobacter frigidisoli TaxID=2530455 RepID=A0A4V2MLH7_9SPHI|nr:YdeI/OmpD-associated family protein [Pedobacter frigidisoli]TCD02127.1 hypothetical protein EZ449_18875 [Pedobacter frigidisoli]